MGHGYQKRKNVKDFFELLNSSGVRYVLIKNIHNELPGHLAIGKDIDILVEERDKLKFRFLMKSIARQYIHPCGTEKESMDKAAKLIATIVTDFEAGQVFEGKVVSIKEFGAFLEFAPGKEGMVHISKISKQRVNKVEDVLKLGDIVKVVCLGKDKMGRFSFSIRDVAE